MVQTVSEEKCILEKLRSVLRILRSRVNTTQFLSVAKAVAERHSDCCLEPASDAIKAINAILDAQDIGWNPMDDGEFMAELSNLLVRLDVQIRDLSNA
jgi:hypothetical protein